MSIQITTRAGKGQPLTATELDANFVNLRDAVYASGLSRLPLCASG